MKKTKTEWLISIIFSLVGVAIIIVGIALQISNINFMKNAIKSTAVITDIFTKYDSDGDTHHKVQIAFSADGKEYKGTLNEYNSGMYKGGTTAIYYDSKNPNDFRSGSTGYVGYILIAFGMLFFIVGSSIIYVSVKKKRKYIELKNNGKRIDAKIDSVYINESYSVNGRHPYVLNCSYVDPVSNKMYEFSSDSIWFNVENIISNNSIETIPVYIDLNNSSRYIVDVEYLQTYLAN